MDDITHLFLLLADSCTTKVSIFKIENTCIVDTCICTYTHAVHYTPTINIHTWKKLLTLLFTSSLSHVTPLLSPSRHPSIHWYLLPSTPYPPVFSQNGNPEAEELVYSHYVICNDTHETLRFGQVDTDENVLLASLHSHQYSWRSHKSPQVAHTHTHTWPRGAQPCGFGWSRVRMSRYTHIGMLIHTLTCKLLVRHKCILIILTWNIYISSHTCQCQHSRV